MVASKIEWTDRSDWNPIRGCTRISPGCGGPGDHGGCYAEAMAGRFSKPGQWGHGFAERTAKGGRWTGEVAIQLDRIELPLRWKKAAKIFASSTSDFFHAALQMEDVAQLFGVMIAAHHLHGHIFQVLTKRADIMRAWLNNPEFWDIANAAAGAHVMERVDPLDRRSDDARATLDDYFPDSPPPGIWLGVSVEDQQRADERQKDFRNTPAAVHFVSYEPALGPVDWTGWNFVDQIIGGGESGPKARPAHPDWFRRTRDWCVANGVAYFHKQWGEWLPTSSVDIYCHGPERNQRQFPNAEGVSMLADGRICCRDFPVKEHARRIAAGEACNSQAVDVDKAAVDEFCATLDRPNSVNPLGYQWLYRVGKKAAGRLLDGVEHNGMPVVRHG